MYVTIHQPEHLPWLGFFDKISQVDLFILLDNVQFRKNYFQNRNKIRVSSKEGWTYLTVPVLQKGRSEQLINEVEINNETNWREKHFRTLQQAYARAPHFKDHQGFLEKLYQTNWKKLIDLNCELIRYLMDAFDINKKVMLASELGETDGHKSDLILSLCRKVQATKYLSGSYGKEYLELDKWKEAHIEVAFHEFTHPVYKQAYDSFVPGLSSIDCLFNLGDESRTFFDATRRHLNTQEFLHKSV